MVTKAGSQDDDLLLAEEVSAMLRVPLATVNAWRGRRRVDGSRPGPPFIRIEGNAVRYRRSAVEKYLEEGAQLATRTGS